jgi:hypothetical protein
LATPKAYPRVTLSCTGPPDENETAAATGIDSGGKDMEIRNERQTYTQNPLWHKLGDVTAAMLKRRLGMCR